MSTFLVKMIQGNQGVSSGGYVGDPSVSNGVSLQRTMFVAGPNGTLRKLVDGESFTDCNYWKRFAYPVMPYDLAFIEVTSDDGSVWSDTPSENTFAVVADFTIEAGETYTDTGCFLDIVTTHGGPAIFTQITTDENIKLKMNGSASAILDIAAGTQVFDSGDVILSEIAFDNTVSGATTATIQVLMSIRSVANS